MKVHEVQCCTKNNGFMRHTVLKEQMSKMAEGAAQWTQRKMAAAKFARLHLCGPRCCYISDNV